LSTFLALADGQSHRLAGLIDQLLDQARLEAGRLRLEPEPVELSGWIVEVAERLRAIYDERTLVVRSAGPLTVDADAQRLEQVVTNLVDNAAKFSPPGLPIEIEVGAGPGGGARIAVRDHGAGVPRGHRARVFERFYQAHGERRYGGMGLGLYLSRQIAELHHGTLAYEEPPGGGARFVVGLPGPGRG
jgi:signal transduction histidine kinase